MGVVWWLVEGVGGGVMWDEVWGCSSGMGGGGGGIGGGMWVDLVGASHSVTSSLNSLFLRTS